MGTEVMGTDRISSTAKEIGGRVESAVGDAVGDRGAQVGGRLREAEGRGERAYADAREAAYDTAQDISAYAGEVYERGSRSLRTGSRAFADQVEDRPFAALLIAGVVGYGLGLLIHRR